MQSKMFRTNLEGLTSNGCYTAFRRLAVVFGRVKTRRGRFRSYNFKVARTENRIQHLPGSRSNQSARLLRQSRLYELRWYSMALRPQNMSTTIFALTFITKLLFFPTRSTHEPILIKFLLFLFLKNTGELEKDTVSGEMKE